jgi:hypothetical protein
MGRSITVLNSLAFHDIVSIDICPPRHHGIGSDHPFSVRDIVITDKDGKEFTFEIFSHLDRVKIMESSCNYNESIVRTPSYYETLIQGEVD